MPDDNDNIFQEALPAHKNNDLIEAQQGYEKVLSTDANHADANHDYGVLITEFTSEIDKSVPFCIDPAESAQVTPLTHMPERAFSWQALGDGLIQGINTKVGFQRI